MDRRTFLGALGAAWAATLQAAFPAPADDRDVGGELMPAFFIGHGSPLNAIEDNRFTRGWTDAMKDVPPPAGHPVRLGPLADARDLRHGDEPAADHPRSPRRLARS